MMRPNSPLPWKREGTDILSNDGAEVLDEPLNDDYIVASANAYPKLVDACRSMLKFMRDRPQFQASPLVYVLRDALAAAGETQ